MRTERIQVELCSGAEGHFPRETAKFPGTALVRCSDWLPLPDRFIIAVEVGDGGGWRSFTDNGKVSCLSTFHS